MNKKIFLSGEPHSGKTTLFNKILSHVKESQGFVTNEIQESGDRTGFEVVTSTKQKAVLARVNEEPGIRVGRYRVYVDSFESVLPDLFVIKPGALLYIDEIGQMELYSDEFRKLVEAYLSAPNDFIATVSSVFKDPLITEIEQSSSAHHFHLTEENRDEVEENIRQLLISKDAV